ncbi:MAG: tyrosine-type recombinase/integrase [Anaerolineae bacterium]|nr:tyrosine-type recombinase/integrase [Anaerolineae bacterium]MDW8099568.1 tyrosine-type recombinase/integrase [Anaerolineae bacterium]
MTIDEALHRFLADLALGQSRKTVRTYAGALNRFCEYLSQIPLSPSTEPAARLTADHAIDFVHWLSGEHFRDHPMSKATLRTYLAALSRFYAYLIREKLASIPADEYERLRKAYHDFRRGGYRRLPRPAAPEIIQRLIQTARSIPSRPDNRPYELRRLRNIAILESLRCTGARVGELVALRRGDLDYRNQSARVVGKGDRERIVYFDDAAWQAVQAYLNARQDSARGHTLHELPLFARHDRAAGRRVLPLSTNTVRQVFEDCLRLAGIEQPLTPHTLRHTFATLALEVTGDLAVVQDLLGHASPATTRVYAKVSARRLREAHRQIFSVRDQSAQSEEDLPRA